VTTPEESIAAAHDRYGTHPGYRALHAKGTLLKGTFRPTPEGARLSRAAHLHADSVPLTARLSNGSGDPGSPDHAFDVRGLAVKLYLPDGAKTDIVAQSLPYFAVSGVAAFNEQLRASKPGPEMAWRMPLFLARNPRVVLALPRLLPRLRPPASYATHRYHALHAFKWIDPDGGERYVRYMLAPEAGEASISPGEARKRGRDYLREEILDRVARTPVRFALELQIADPGDDPDDPSKRWPDHRERMVAGTIDLTEPETEREQGDDVLVFDPTRVVDGIELSDDPILRFRTRAYSASVLERTGVQRPEKLA
jgi:catalase